MKKTYEAAAIVTQGDVVAVTESGFEKGNELRTKAVPVGSVGFVL